MREDFVCCGSPGSMRRRLVWFCGLDSAAQLNSMLCSSRFSWSVVEVALLNKLAIGDRYLHCTGQKCVCTGCVLICEVCDNR